jgi:hypothetical protein
MRAHSQSSHPTSHPKQISSKEITAEQRRQMIAEAAYYIAESRGFQGSCELDDWLCAETKVNKQLSGKQQD